MPQQANKGESYQSYESRFIAYLIEIAKTSPDLRKAVKTIAAELKGNIKDQFQLMDIVREGLGDHLLSIDRDGLGTLLSDALHPLSYGANMKEFTAWTTGHLGSLLEKALGEDCGRPKRGDFGRAGRRR